MSFHMHNIDQNDPEAMMRAMMGDEAIGMNNAALGMSNAGNHTGAIQTQLEALRHKEAAFGPDAVPTAITYNALGERYHDVGDWQNAEKYLKKAYKVRENAGTGFDAAVTRENLGRVYEAMGQWEQAKAIRREGKKGTRDEVACSNYKCPGQTFGLDELKRCGSCATPLYCSIPCQKADWTSRHKVLCKARAAAA